MSLRHCLGLLAALFLLSSCSNQTVDRLFTHYKKDDSAIAATLPGWLVEKGLSLAFKQEGPEALAQFRDVVKDIKKVRVLVSKNKAENHLVKSLSKNMVREKYELFTMVRHQDSNINLWVRENKTVAKDIFVFIQSDDNVVLLQVKGEIDMSSVEKIDINQV